MPLYKFGILNGQAYSWGYSNLQNIFLVLIFALFLIMTEKLSGL